MESSDTEAVSVFAKYPPHCSLTVRPSARLFCEGYLMRDSRSKVKRFSQRLAVLASLLGVLLVGCRDEAVPTGTVRGKVLLDDSPYTDAAVVFLSPETGAAASADIQPDGTFRIETPLKVGSYTVFLAPKLGAAEKGKEQPASSDEPLPEMEQSVPIDESVPDKYWNEATSDISIQVVEGENDVTVPLSK